MLVSVFSDFEISGDSTYPTKLFRDPKNLEEYKPF